MRRSVAVAATLVAGFAVAAPGGARADLSLPSVTPTPLPSVSVPLPVPTGTPLPEPSLTSPVEDTTRSGGDRVSETTGGTTVDSGPAAGTGPVDSPGPAGSGDSTTAAAGAAGAARDKAGAPGRALRRVDRPVPLLADRPEARQLLDDEQSPQLLRASRRFLTADQAIAEIARQKRLMARLEQSARDLAAAYRAFEYEIGTAREASRRMHERHEQLRHQLAEAVRRSYVTGVPAASASVAPELSQALARFGDGGTRADLRLGTLNVQRDALRAEFDRAARSYEAAKRRLADANRRIRALTAERTAALQAVQAAQGSDIAQHQARLTQSGELGSRIRAASAELERSGRTVAGSGEFVSPLAGTVTSPFGMRRHPILGYVKLHTGADIAGGDTILAPDDGRVLMTVTNPAYGLLTVIDHGVIDGTRVTTAYAHQSSFLVRAGQEVRKGDPIGVVGSTGYSTGPHLHFEVREDGAVVDPMRWLTR